MKRISVPVLIKMTPARAAMVGAVSLALGLSSAPGAILTKVPMQGGMVMPEVSYSSSDGRLHVWMPTTIPQLTPLLVSHPADSFDPADPWYYALDPSGGGLAFSMRYGFTMAEDTEQIPLDTQMWIRKLSGSPDLLAYRCTNPRGFQPLWGTEGVTNALYWDGTMFHPLFAAPPGTNTFHATFELYLLDTTLGQEIAGSSSGPLLFEWTEVPDGRPALTMNQNLALSWPTPTVTWELEGTDSLTNGTWTAVNTIPVLQEGKSTVQLLPGDTRKFFRLRLVR